MTNPRDQLRFFAYCRKSSEDDRQAASIGDQLRELVQLIERERLTLAAEPFTEEKSAKGPGRPVFTEMLRRIERGQANAIVCWDIDRLYRNPVDEGRVRWLLQRGIIQEIRTPFRTFQPHDAGLLMGVEGGRATDHIITLRKGVLRGFRGKLAKGQRPGVAPPGYLNNLNRQKGERDVIPDPERFHLIQRAWELVLTGRYSVRDIQRIAAEEWQLRSRKTKKLGAKPYNVSAWYRIFTEPFYCGSFWWKEPGTEIRRLYKGAHVPMITEDEFDRVQFLLGRKGKPGRRTHRFAFTGLIRCGECGALVTAETKHQIICPSCKKKFSAPNKHACPSCGLRIERMEHPTRLSYTYYHCTKQKDHGCSQRCVRSEKLEGQIDEILARVTVSEAFLGWSTKALCQAEAHDDDAEKNARASLERRRADIKRQLAHINALVLSPDTDWELVSRDEVKGQKTRLLAELEKIEQDPREEAGRLTTLELSERTFLFAAYARFWFREGDLEQKRAILGALGSNLTLKEKKLALELRKPLRYVAELVSRVPSVRGGFEPANGGLNKRKSPLLWAEIPCLRWGMNAIRTYFLRTLECTPLHSFLQNSPLLRPFEGGLRGRGGPRKGLRRRRSMEKPGYFDA